MIVTLTTLAGLISSLCVALLASTLSELRREREDIENFARRHTAF
ncbi:hypothetical protein N7E02_25255 [Aliirhizobium terrae]|nr:hypothetical protein [Rhizobium sp. CC-CFT758]WJH39950.1 hypothetical protein N7E02_25255 [Rhizobium sp. CC-CFT758]